MKIKEIRCITEIGTSETDPVYNSLTLSVKADTAGIADSATMAHTIVLDENCYGIAAPSGTPSTGTVYYQINNPTSTN